MDCNCGPILLKPAKRNLRFKDGKERQRIVELRTEAGSAKIRLSWVMKRQLVSANGLTKFVVKIRVCVKQRERGGHYTSKKPNEKHPFAPQKGHFLVPDWFMEEQLPIRGNKMFENLEFPTMPGALYSVEFNILERQGTMLFTDVFDVRADFSHSELEQLMEKAANFVGIHWEPFNFLHRTKREDYWDDEEFVQNEIMRTYPKDNGGHPGCAINQLLKGLHFSAKTVGHDPDKLPPKSPYGDMRFKIPPIQLLNPDLVNFFFADFYCSHTHRELNEAHKVLIVVAKKDSESHKMCKQMLIPLDIFNNPFLMIKNSPTGELNFLYNAKSDVWVEVLYTEDVPFAWGKLLEDERVHVVGKCGRSNPRGLRPYLSCRICNLCPEHPWPETNPTEELGEIDGFALSRAISSDISNDNSALYPQAQNSPNFSQNSWGFPGGKIPAFKRPLNRKF